MQRIFIIILLLTPFRCLYAQDQRMIDSVMPLIKNDGSRNDMEIFYELGFQYFFTDQLQALDYLRKGRSIAYKIGDSLMIVKFNRITGQVYQNYGKLQEAIVLLDSLLPMAKRLELSREVGFILKTIAVVYTHMARYDRALEYNFRALELWRQQRDSSQTGAILNNIGLIHYKVGNYDRALDYYKQSLLIAEQSRSPGPSHLMQILFVNIAMVNIELKNFNEAEQWLEKCMVQCSSYCSSDVLVSAFFSLGYLKFESKQFREAKNHFERSFVLAKKTEDARFMAENLNYIGHIARLEKKFDSAYHYLSESQRLSIDGDFRNVLAYNFYQQFLLYKDLKELNRSSAFLEKFLSLNDSIHSWLIRNRMAVMQIEFDEREYAVELSHQKELLARQKTETRLLTAIVVLSALLAMGLFMLWRGKMRANQLLDRRVAERTRELESNKVALERSFYEQRELVNKTAESIRSAMATQRGLHAAIIERKAFDPDVVHSTEQIVDRLNSLAEQLAQKKKTEIDQSHSTL